MAVYLAHSKGTLATSCTNSVWICPRNTVSLLLSRILNQIRLMGGCELRCTFHFPNPGRGGQSALRFARLRMEKRHNYVRKVAEVATQLYITGDKANVE